MFGSVVIELRHGMISLRQITEILKNLKSNFPIFSLLVIQNKWTRLVTWRSVVIFSRTGPRWRRPIGHSHLILRVKLKQMYRQNIRDVRTKIMRQNKLWFHHSWFHGINIKKRNEMTVCQNILQLTQIILKIKCFIHEWKRLLGFRDDHHMQSRSHSSSPKIQTFRGPGSTILIKFPSVGMTTDSYTYTLPFPNTFYWTYFTILKLQRSEIQLTLILSLLFNIFNEVECTDKNRDCTNRAGGTEKWGQLPPCHHWLRYWCNVVFWLRNMKYWR